MRDRSRFSYPDPIAWPAFILAVGVLLAASAASTAADGGPPRLADLNGRVAALIVHEGELVAGGSFTGSLNGAPVHYVARWRNGSWQALGGEPDGPVEALATLQGKLVVAGEFENVGGMPAAHIAMWDDSGWSALGEGANGPVYALRTQVDYILYVGGAFTEAGGRRSRSVARWIGGTWSPLGAGLAGQVNALEIYNGNLVAGGDFRLGGTNPYEQNLATLVGDEWRPMALGIDGHVSALTLWNGMLVAGGTFLQADFVTPAHHIAGFTNGVWSAVGFGFGAQDSMDTSDVCALHVCNGELIAGGDFVLADLRPTNRIARYDGADWWPLGAGTDGMVESFAVQGDLLYVGGDFSQAGGRTAGCVAGYCGGNWLPMGSVPVVVEDLQATPTPAGVELRWALAAEAIDALLGVEVERAAAAEGPYACRTPVPLAPRTQMAFVDADQPGQGEGWFYRIVLVEADGSRRSFGPIEVGALPARTALLLPYDPGAGRSVVLGYRLATPTAVQLEIFDVRGRVLRRLDVGMRLAGEHVQRWDRFDATGRRASRGVYFVRLQAEGAQAIGKLVLMHD